MTELFHKNAEQKIIIKASVMYAYRNRSYLHHKVTINKLITDKKAV